MRLGSLEEHALLLASMFRAVKYESTEDIFQESDVTKKTTKTSKGNTKGPSSLNDRVFVCLGKLKETGADHAWVMTLNRTYDEVIMWDVTQPRKFKLEGRITEDNSAKL